MMDDYIDWSFKKDNGILIPKNMESHSFKFEARPQVMNAGYDIKIISSPIIRDGEPVLMMSENDYKAYAAQLKGKDEAFNIHGDKITDKDVYGQTHDK